MIPHHIVRLLYASHVMQREHPPLIMKGHALPCRNCGTSAQDRLSQRSSELEESARVVKGITSNIKMPNGKIITFSGVREPLKIGLLKAMLRNAEITEEAFVRLLEGET